MRIGWRTIVGAITGAVAAVVWAVSLAIYQPIMEPSGTWTDPTTGVSYPNVASNNTYWPRDIRQLAILLAFAALVLIAGANVRGIVTGGVAALAWLGADLWLDRIDVGGAGLAWWLAGAGILGFAVVAVLTVRVSAGRLGTELARHLAAATAALLATVTVIVETPFDEPVTGPDLVRVELALIVLKVTLVVLFAVTALGLVARPVDRARTRWGVALAVLAVAATWPVLATYVVPAGAGLVVVPVLASLAVTAVTAAREVSIMRIVSVAPCAALALLAAFAPLYIGGIVIGGAMTRLAGNPAVNGADSDLSIALVGLAIGLLLATVSYGVTRPWALGGVPEAQPS